MLLGAVLGWKEKRGDVGVVYAAGGEGGRGHTGPARHPWGGDRWQRVRSLAPMPHVFGY